MDNQYKAYKLNILLVRHKGRTACLLEPSGFEDKKCIEKLVNYAKSLKLYTREDRHKRILITRQEVTGELTDARIGQYLDFLCYDHDDFQDISLDRYDIFIHIGEYNIQTEVCVASKVSRMQIDAHVESVKRRWRDVLKKLKIDLEVSSHVHFDSSVFSRLKFIEERNVERAFELKEEYVDDLFNALHGYGLFALMLEGCQESKDMMLFMDKLPAFYVFAVINDGLYSPPFTGDNYQAIDEARVKNLVIERDFLSLPDEVIADVYLNYRR